LPPPGLAHTSPKSLIGELHELRGEVPDHPLGRGLVGHAGSFLSLNAVLPG